MDASDEYEDYSTTSRGSDGLPGAVTEDSLDLSAREVTTIVSTVSVVLLMLIGLCIFLCVRCLRRRESNSYVHQNGHAASSGPCVSGSKNGEKFRIVPHKNIFTPHQNFSFVLPTVSLLLTIRLLNVGGEGERIVPNVFLYVMKLNGFYGPYYYDYYYYYYDFT